MESEVKYIPGEEIRNIPEEEHMNNLMSKPEYYELQFMQVLPYEAEFGWSPEQKVEMIDKIFTYLAQRNIHVRFSDRIIDNSKPWTRQEGQEWRPVEVGELHGNMIVINPRNIDFLSVLLTIAHVYGHLVQRETPEVYEPLTRFTDYPKPLDLDEVQTRYEADRPGREYWADFLDFEKEAFAYGKHAMLQSGIGFDEKLDHAVQSYIEADFKELKRWSTTAPNKWGGDFVKEFERTYNDNKGRWPALAAKPVEIEVKPDPNGELIVVRTKAQA
jgi:hypothetical protein